MTGCISRGGGTEARITGLLRGCKNGCVRRIPSACNGSAPIGGERGMLGVLRDITVTGREREREYPRNFAMKQD